MHVRYFYPWGYFYPVTCGTDVVAAHHLEYFRERGWTVDCVLVAGAHKAAFAERFRAQYAWLRDLTLIELPPARFELSGRHFANGCLKLQLHKV